MSHIQSLDSDTLKQQIDMQQFITIILHRVVYLSSHHVIMMIIWNNQ